MPSVNDNPPLVGQATIDFSWTAGGAVGFTVLSTPPDTFPPNSDPRYAANKTTANVPIVFTASVSLPAGVVPIAYLWDFGDRTTGVGSTVTHTYKVVVGDTQCTLVVIDSLGKQYSVTHVMNLSGSSSLVSIREDMLP